MEQPLPFSYGVIGQQLGWAGLGGARQEERFLASISECTEEQRHTEHGWVAISCEARHPGPAVQIQGQPHKGAKMRLQVLPARHGTLAGGLAEAVAQRAKEMFSGSSLTRKCF